MKRLYIDYETVFKNYVVKAMAKRGRKPFVRKPRPFAVDNVLRNIGLGITVGEALVRKRKRVGRAPEIVIRVNMCDEKAVRMLAESWGTSVFQPKGWYCKKTPENPEGRIYSTEASGERAELIMRGYEPEILGTEIHKKWLRLFR